MAKPPTALVRRSQGTQAPARVSVEQDVVFTQGWGQWGALAGILVFVTAFNTPLGFWLGLGLMFGSGMPHRKGSSLLREVLDSRRPQPPQEVTTALRRLLRKRWLPSGVRADVAGWLALGLLEQGELEPALEVLRGPVFAGRRRPRRAISGMTGEGIRAIIGSLFPEAGWPVLPSEALLDDDRSLREQFRLTVMRAVLRLLEATRTGDPELVAMRWAELPPAPLAPLPVLMTLIRAEAARVQPALGVDLEARIRALSPEGRRLVLQRPSAVRFEDTQGYRTAALAPVEPSTTLAVPERLGAVAGLGLGGSSGLALTALALSCTVHLGMLMGGLGLVATLAGWHGLSMLTGFPRVLKRRDRIQPLLAAGIERSAWLRELAHMRTRSHSRRKWAAKLGPFDRDHVMLVLGVQRAEQAVLERDWVTARDSIGWWLGNLSPVVLRELDPVALGAALLRMAGELGFDDAVELLQGIQPRTRRWVPRSGHGDAPRAMALARALVDARRDRWNAAVEHVAEACEHPAVTWDPVDVALYDWLLGELADRGHPGFEVWLGLPLPRSRRP